MRLRVKTLTRRVFALDVHPSEAIDELKTRLTQETGIPLAGQKLVYKGEVLDGGCVQVFDVGGVMPIQVLARLADECLIPKPCCW